MHYVYQPVWGTEIREFGSQAELDLNSSYAIE